MNIVLAYPGRVPTPLYGGTERVIWCLGRELRRMGHRVSFLAAEGSRCDFAPVITFRPGASVDQSIPGDTDLVHLHFSPGEPVEKPSLFTMHGNPTDVAPLPRNTVFVSRQHAGRYGSGCFVHNGLDWSEYGAIDLDRKREYFHFLGKAAWRVKNVRGAIELARRCRRELKVLGGRRLNFKMGFRLTLTRWASFHGIVDDRQKKEILSGSRGLVFPVRWHEPFGLALLNPHAADAWPSAHHSWVAGDALQGCHVEAVLRHSSARGATCRRPRAAGPSRHPIPARPSRLSLAAPACAAWTDSRRCQYHWNTSGGIRWLSLVADS